MSKDTASFILMTILCLVILVVNEINSRKRRAAEEALAELEQKYEVLQMYTQVLKRAYDQRGHHIITATSKK